MARHFVFNGDADGLCALQQLRLEEPAPATLLTGVKRDIDLVSRLDAQAGDQLTVLDVSLDSNARAVRSLLGRGVRVRYFDHHYPGELFAHPNLELHIDTAPAVCTSLIVNRYLDGKRRRWAAVGAFGDNLEQPARAALEGAALAEREIETLRTLGICLNYNAYGESESDLLIAPAELHRRLMAYENPLDFARADPLFDNLRLRYEADLHLAAQTQPHVRTECAAVYLLPDASWSRRVSGLWGNTLANAHPGRAHAVLTCKPGGGYLVSVRSAQGASCSAVALCRQFGGGGREAAAGINNLPAESLDLFCREFLAHYRRP